MPRHDDIFERLHIQREEDEHFPGFAQHLVEEDVEYMRNVFERRQHAEKAAAEVTPAKLADVQD